MTLVDAFENHFNVGAVITFWSRKHFWCIPPNKANTKAYVGSDKLCEHRQRA